MMKINLLKSPKDLKEPTKRENLFKTVYKSGGKCCKVITDSVSIDNIVSTKMVENLNLWKNKHPTPYKVSWLQKVHQILVNEQCEVEF